MTTSERPMEHHDDRPVPLLAAVAALEAIQDALRAAARVPEPMEAEEAEGAEGPERALDSLHLLRQVRERLASWEPGLIEAARDGGASWAELAAPLGVASRQAAERRYLRLRPGPAGTTGEERVRATRDRRAAERTVTAWARDNAADLRRLAAQVSALGDFPPAARPSLRVLDQALACSDPADLIHPLCAVHPYLEASHPALAAHLSALMTHMDRLRCAPEREAPRGARRDAGDGSGRDLVAEPDRGPGPGAGRGHDRSPVRQA
ncbi:hypothetical protein ACFVIM_07730 [Streptomyces sp. NPDC057638]|uniref:hypothetical protein n=1 Tax=Streptomyces sp. NPDC057638 TaxID=3346190 RepID=UPI0036764E40